VLHGFVANEGEFRLAVSKILKGNYVVRIGYGFMFYSILRSVDLVSIRVGKVHGGDDLLMQNCFGLRRGSWSGDSKADQGNGEEGHPVEIVGTFPGHAERRAESR
jgi:hypothetical protein